MKAVETKYTSIGVGYILVMSSLVRFKTSPKQKLKEPLNKESKDQKEDLISQHDTLKKKA
jgi:hypothetical protein